MTRAAPVNASNVLHRTTRPGGVTAQHPQGGMPDTTAVSARTRSKTAQGRKMLGVLPGTLSDPQPPQVAQQPFHELLIIPDMQHVLARCLDPKDLAITLAAASPGVNRFTAPARSRALTHHLGRVGSDWEEAPDGATWAEQQDDGWPVALSRVAQVTLDQLLQEIPIDAPHGSVAAPGEALRISCRSAALERLASQLGPHTRPLSARPPASMRAGRDRVALLIGALGALLPDRPEQRVGPLRELVWTAADIDDLDLRQSRSTGARPQPVMPSVKQAIRTLAPPAAVEWLAPLADIHDADGAKARAGLDAFMAVVDAQPLGSDVTWAIEALIGVSSAYVTRASGAPGVDASLPPGDWRASTTWTPAGVCSTGPGHRLGSSRRSR